jgi:hypothetical protein
MTTTTDTTRYGTAVAQTWDRLHRRGWPGISNVSGLELRLPRKR